MVSNISSVFKRQLNTALNTALNGKLQKGIKMAFKSLQKKCHLYTGQLKVKNVDVSEFQASCIKAVTVPLIVEIKQKSNSFCSVKFYLCLYFLKGRGCKKPFSRFR